MIDIEQREKWAQDIANVLCESWGWLPDEPEALQLGRNLAYNLELMVANTRTSPRAFLGGLLPLGAVTETESVGTPTRQITIQENR